MSAAISNNQLYHIDKLTNSNFTMWKYVEVEAEEALAQIVLIVSHNVVGHTENECWDKKDYPQNLDKGDDSTHPTVMDDKEQ